MSLTEEELKKIGGSDAPAIAGVSPWKGPIDVWRRIVEGVQTADNASMRRGRRLEPVLLAEYADETGAKLLGPAKFEFPGRPFCRASTDSIAELPDERRVVECKTVNFRQAHRWAEGVPHDVLAQTQWYLNASGLRRADVVALLGGAELRIFTVEADAEAQGILLEMATKFWVDYVKTKRPPPPDASDSYSAWLAQQYPDHEKPLLASNADLDALAWRFLAAQEAKDKAETEIAEVQNSIKACLGTAEGVEGPWGKITWKANKATEKTDWAAVAKELGAPPALVAKHTETRPGPRVFRAYWRQP